jgi:hypothetical protein
MINSEMRWAYRANGENRNAYRIPMEKLEGKRSVGRPKHSCEDKIKIILDSMGWYTLH